MAHLQIAGVLAYTRPSSSNFNDLKRQVVLLAEKGHCTMVLNSSVVVFQLRKSKQSYSCIISKSSIQQPHLETM